MNGLDKITEQILTDAAEAAKAVLSAAETECAEIGEQYRLEAESEAEAIISAGRITAVRQAELLAASAQTEAKKAILSEKQKLIVEAFRMSADKLNNMNDIGKFDIQLVKADGTVESKRDVSMLIERIKNELTPKVAEILFADAGI